MKKIYLALAATVLWLGAAAQSISYVPDVNYNNKGYRFFEQVPAQNQDGAATAIKLNDDGSEYVAVRQLVTSSSYSIAGLVKYKANGTPDSAFATNGLASNFVGQDVTVYDIDFLTGNKIYCSGSGWGGFVWDGSTWYSQVYGGGTVAPGLYSTDGCKATDSSVVQVGLGNDIIFLKDNGNNTYGWYAYSNPVDYQIEGITRVPAFKKVAAVVNSHYFVAGIADSFAFIAKYTAGTFTLDNTWGSSGLVTFKLQDISNINTFKDLVVQPDGKVLAMFEGQLPGIGSANTYVYRFNTDGTPDTGFGTNGKFMFPGVNRLTVLPDGSIALLYAYNFSSTNTVGIALFSSAGQEISVDMNFPIPTSSGYQQVAVPLAISSNAAGDIALCGYLVDSATNYQKPFTMRLKRFECSLQASINVYAHNAFTATLSNIALPAVAYIGEEGSEGYQFTDTLQQGNSVTFEGLTQNATYIFFVRDANGCTVTANVDLSQLSPNAISSHEILKFSIYPNPVNDVLTIYTDEEIAAIQILDVTGREVKAQTGNYKTINVEDLNTGVYLLRPVNAEGKATALKFLKN